MDKEQILTLLHRLRHEPSYMLHSDEKQLRRDAADALEALLRRVGGTHGADVSGGVHKKPHEQT